MDTADILRAAIGKGAPMYNRGDIKGCAKLYQQAAEKALPRASVPGVQQRLKQGLQEARGNEAKDAAWALRRAFDDVLDGSVGRGSADSLQHAAMSALAPRDGAQTAAGRRAVGAMIREAISLGVPIYNSGDPRGCAEVYGECCQDMLDLQGGLDAQTHQAVEQVLLQLPSLPSDDKRAWALRRCIDAVLVGEVPITEPAPVKLSSSRTLDAAELDSTAEDVKSTSKPASAAAAGPKGGSVASHVALLEGKNIAVAAAASPAAKSSAAPPPKETMTIDDQKSGTSGSVVAEVQDDGWEEELACSICLEFLWDPVKLGCGHNFCRCCLLRTTQLSPDGGSCPNCRTKIDIDPDKAPADESLQARVKAVVPADQLALRQENGDRDLAELREVKQFTIPVFMMSPGVRPGDPVSLNLFEPRYREMARRIMAPGGEKLFVFMGRQPSSGESGSLVLVQNTSQQINGNVGITGMAMCSVKLDQVWVDDGAHGLFYCKTTSPLVAKVLARGLGALAEGRMGGRRQRAVGAQDGDEEGRSDTGSGSNASADLPVFFMRGGSCRVGQRVILNLFETRYRALAAIVMSTHRMFIFATDEPQTGSPGILVRVNSCEFLRDGTARVNGRGIEEVTLLRVRTDRSVGNLMHARVRIASMAAITALESGESGTAPAGNEDDLAGDGTPVRGNVGKKKKCSIM